MPEQPHTSMEAWQTFEIRMRRRRAERLLLRAEAALQAGFDDDARTALFEARQLDPFIPDLFELRQRVSLSPVPSEIAPAPSRRPWIPIAAGVALMLGVAVAWVGIGPGRGNVASSAEAPAPESGAEVRSQPPAPTDTVSIRHLVVVPTITGAIGTTGPNESPVRERQALRPDAAVARATVPAPVLLAPAIDVDPLERPARLETSAPPSPPPAVPAPAAPPVRAADPTPAPPEAPAPVKPAPVDERAGVRSVLSRYEAAYTGLDASAAHAVWPNVDRRALARAFDGLESQRLSLGRCDVTVDGSSARAECAGSATWTPKVGAGRTEPRRWAFDLRQQSGAWQIVSADVR